jgi:hypothetical protein
MKQYHYKKVIGFTEQQRQAFVILEDYGVNVNKFIRQAIAEKIKKDWKEIKAEKTTFHCPF